MKFVSVVVDFFLVALTIEVSDGQSVRSLAVAVAYDVITQDGRENFVGILASVTGITVTQILDFITGVFLSSMIFFVQSFSKIVIT